MATPETVDIALLVAPLDGDSPTGTDLMFDPLYDQMKEAVRGGGRSQLEADAREPDWRVLQRLTVDALTSRTKDLQIAAWLTEALARLEGFAGLRDGLIVIRELHERFWDGLHPQVEDGDLGVRAARLSYLNDASEGGGREALGAAIQRIPLTHGDAAYGLFDYAESRETDNLSRQSAEKYQAALEAGRLTGEHFDRAVASGRRAFYEVLFADAQAALDECDRLQAVVVRQYGKDAPSLLNVHRAIEDCRDLVGKILEEKRRLEPDAVVDEASGPASGAAPVAQARSGPMTLEPVDRADAVRRLAGVASFFKRTEPHSPVAYLVQRAMRWAEMPLEDWLQEVLGDETALGRVRDTLGIKGS